MYNVVQYILLSPALTLLGKLVHHLAWNYGCCYCCTCCHSEPPPKIKRLTAVVDSIEQYRSVISRLELCHWSILTFTEP